MWKHHTKEGIINIVRVPPRLLLLWAQVPLLLLFLTWGDEEEEEQENREEREEGEKE